MKVSYSDTVLPSPEDVLTTVWRFKSPCTHTPYCRRCYQQALQEFPEYFSGIEAISDYSSNKSVRGCVNVAQGLVSKYHIQLISTENNTGWLIRLATLILAFTLSAILFSCWWKFGIKGWLVVGRKGLVAGHPKQSQHIPVNNMMSHPVQRWDLFFANLTKQDPGRARQSS